MGDFKFLKTSPAFDLIVTSPAMVKIDNASIFELTDNVVKSIEITAGNVGIILSVTCESTSPDYSSNSIEYRIDGTNNGWIYIKDGSIKTHEYSLEEIESYIGELTNGNK